VDDDKLKQLDALIERHDEFIHVTHVNPDADGIGSALAMSRYLTSLGKRSRVVIPSPLPRRLAFFTRPGEIQSVIAPDIPHFSPDAVVALYDISNLGRLGTLEAPLRASRAPKVVFDHHDGDADLDGLAFIDEGAGATGQVIFEVLEARHVHISVDLALPLYVALVADTGSFNYGKTSPRTHVIAAALLEAGVRPLEVHGMLEGTRSLAAVRALGEVVAGIQVDGEDSRIAHATLRHELLSTGGSEPLDAGDLVNYTIALDGVLAGVLFVQVEPRVTRLSFRSKAGVSVVETARALGGGGHMNAAGATVTAPLEEVRTRVLTHLRKSLGEQVGPASGRRAG